MILSAEGVSKVYSDTEVPVKVLNNVSLDIASGEACGISGASGSGKSTLLHIMGAIDSPTGGTVRLCGKEISSMPKKELARFRCTEVGFVFQFYHLLPEFTALENVMLPALIAGRSRESARMSALSVLQEMALEDRAKHLPSALSGGEQQRVAIARAAVMRPKIIFADEPTGNLDTKTGEVVWGFLMKLNRVDKITIVVVSHNDSLLATLGTLYRLDSGELVRDEKRLKTTVK